MTHRITMAQVAERAGVHVTTVSLALRNNPSLPLATRERIRSLAETMGYRPDPALHALTVYRHAKTQRRDTPPLAYLTHWDSELGWKRPRTHARFFAGAVAKATELGRRIEHFWLGEAGLSHQRMSDILFARGITGLIVASHLPEHDQLLELDWAKFSAVKIGYLPREPVLHRVTNDHRAIVRLAMRRIMAAGHRRIGLVMPHWWDAFGDCAWSAGFLAEQQRFAPEECIPILYFSTDPGSHELQVPAKSLAAWLKRHRPEVVLSKAQFVEAALAELGVSVPRDVAFVDLFLDPDGRTAGVRNNCERVGALAVEILGGQLQQNSFGIPEFPTSMLVEGTWFDGLSLPRGERVVADLGGDNRAM